jgi:hypothetical protein
VVALPYLIYLHGQSGSWTFSNKPWNTYLSMRALEQKDRVAFDRANWALDSSGNEVMFHSTERFAHSLSEEIMANPQEFVAGLIHNARQMRSILFSRQAVPLFLLPIVALGLLKGPWTRRRVSDGLLLLLLFITTIVTFLPFGVILRYVLGSVFVLMIWAGRGMCESLRWVAGNLSRLVGGRQTAARWEAGAIVFSLVALVAYFIALQPPIIREGRGNMPFHYKVIGEWLGAHSAPGETIMSRGSIPALYADRQWVAFPTASYDEVMRYARQHNVSYVVVNQREFEQTRPQLAFLGDPQSDHPGLELLCTYRDTHGATVVYRLSP